jgi:DNA-binding NarL/FixJ family response regulator
MAVEAALEQTRVLVVDDHTTFAELLMGALNRESDLVSIGHAESVEAGVAMTLSLRPDVVVMDYHLADGNGLAAAEKILAREPSTRIVMLTGDPSTDILERAAALGTCAFLPKDGSLAIMLDTLRQARPGSMIVHPSLLAQLVNRRQQQDSAGPVPALTQRELEVLRLMAKGHDVRANAKTLGISQNTCRGYVKSILAKLGVHSQLEAVVTATRLNLLSAEWDG